MRPEKKKEEFFYVLTELFPTILHKFKNMWLLLLDLIAALFICSQDTFLAAQVVPVTEEKD